MAASSLGKSLCRRVSIVLPIAMLLSLVGATPAQAWKPNTHTASGYAARGDLLDGDGGVNIGGREYPVKPEVLSAIRDYPSFYNAGVVGPDGFPDLIMGQSIIHPTDTGRWLAYLFSHAWAAQSDATFSPAEKSQILAFTYGYLTHAAGDMWGHTLINQFAGGVFPDVATVLTDPRDLSNAVRHILTEAYVGDATPGYDGNRSTRKVLPDGDISDDSTPGIAYDVPVRFVYQTLVRHNADEPAPGRGVLIDFFFSLRAKLAAVAIPLVTGQNLQNFVNDFNSLKAQFDAIANDECDFNGVLDSIHDLIACPIALLALGFNAVINGISDFLNLVAGAIHDAFALVFNAYLDAWIADIDDGLQHWAELGLASTRGLFDPQTRRDLQNDPGLDGCGSLGADVLDTTTVRSQCEDKMGVFHVVMHEIEDFKNGHLLSMLGLPDFVGSALSALGDALDAIDAIVGPAFNPIREGINGIKNAITDLIKQAIEQRFGVNIDQVEEFFSSPSSKMDVTSLTIGTPGGPVTISLFQTGDHAKLDGYLGLPPNHHTGDGGGLGDDIVFDPVNFAAFTDTVTMAKLLLLDGPTLDTVLSDRVGHTVHLYGSVPNANIMTTSFPGVPASQLFESSKPDEWLRLIDGDHAWRKDGLPIFADNTRFGGPGGNGNFPLWKSCILRDRVFRSIFTDWENPTHVPAGPGDSANFPTFGDPVIHDPNDPNPPVSALSTSGPKFVNGAGTTFLGVGNGITILAHDDFWSNSEELLDITVAGPAAYNVTGTFANPNVLHLAGADGTYQVLFNAHDPCRAEAQQTNSFVLDTTAPVVTFTEPAQAVYTTDQMSSIQYSANDGALGSGVASTSVTFDGAAAVNGQVLDMFFLNPGLHTIVVTATDNLSNTGTTTRTFTLTPTAASLINTLDRALALGLITNNGAYNGLHAKLLAAQSAHDRGDHATEWNILGAFINQVTAKTGNGIDPATAARLIAFAQFIIDNHG